MGLIQRLGNLGAKIGSKSGDRICDPACRSGGLLIEAAREVGDSNYALFGMGVNGSTWALARMNMFLHKADSDRFWRGVPPKSKGDWAFISHMVEAAQEKESRVSVVVPHGVLFRGAAEGRIRQKMIEENLLDTVVGLPGNLFPTTSIPVAILVFDRSREKGGANQRCMDVLFLDASREYLPMQLIGTVWPTGQLPAQEWMRKKEVSE
jgi:type I restriction enzyme M protein